MTAQEAIEIQLLNRGVPQAAFPPDLQTAERADKPLSREEQREATRAANNE